LPKLGQPGLLREKKKSTDWGAFIDGNIPVVEKNLMTSFETYALSRDDAINRDVNYQQKLSGWFTAPATANYRFYIACDDACKLLLDAENPLSSGTPT